MDHTRQLGEAVRQGNGGSLAAPLAPTGGWEDPPTPGDVRLLHLFLSRPHFIRAVISYLVQMADFLASHRTIYSRGSCKLFVLVINGRCRKYGELAVGWLPSMSHPLKPCYLAVYFAT